MTADGAIAEVSVKDLIDIPEAIRIASERLGRAIPKATFNNWIHHTAAGVNLGVVRIGRSYFTTIAMLDEYLAERAARKARRPNRGRAG